MYKGTKVFFKGILNIVKWIILAPFLAQLFLIGIVFWIGGADPMDTPIRRFINKYLYWL